MEKSSGKDYSKQGINLNDMLEILNVSKKKSCGLLNTGSFPCRQQGAADQSWLGLVKGGFRDGKFAVERILKVLQSKYGKPKSCFLIFKVFF